MTSKKVALVTGASSGLGYDIAKTLASEGYFVLGCARRADKLKQLSVEIEKSGNSFKAYQCDFKSEDQILHMFKQIRNEFGVLDVINVVWIVNVGVHYA